MKLIHSSRLRVTGTKYSPDGDDSRIPDCLTKTELTLWDRRGTGRHFLCILFTNNIEHVFSTSALCYI